MKYMVDIDNTICYNENSNYVDSTPDHVRIAKLNALFDEGHEIHYWTARGGNSGKDWTELTHKQLKDWNVKHTSLTMKKPVYDICCLLYTSPSPRDLSTSRMPSSA